MKDKNLFQTDVEPSGDLRTRNQNAPPEARGLLASLKIWWTALRYHFTPSSFLPAILGGTVAWVQTGLMNQTFFFLTVLGVTLNHIALNLTDDYFDYNAAVDRISDKKVKPFSGGSGVLTDGGIDHTQVRSIFIAAYLATIGIGLYLCVSQTWWILVFGVLGMGSSYFYTAPPVRYGYRGFGEISQLVNFSFTIGMGAYVVQTVSLSWEAFWVLLPLGCMMFAMIIINEIPDREGDAVANKRTLVVRFGAKKAVFLYGVFMSLAYIIILWVPPLGGTSVWIYLALLTLPWAVQSFSILCRNFSKPAELTQANLLTIRIHNLTGILLIVAYLIQGIQNHRVMHPALFLALILLVFYLPAVVSVFFKKV